MASKTIADFVDIVMGQSPPGNTVSGDIGIPLLNGPTEFGPYHPTPVQFTTDARKIANPGDLLFCVRGSTTGRMNWADQKYAIGRGIAAFRHRWIDELQPFVRAVIEFQLPALLAQATGSTFPSISASQLAAIPYPNFGEAAQYAIAYILGTLDDKIKLNRQMNETLEAMVRAIFKSWFVDFDPVRAKMEGRQPAGMDAETAALFPSAFQNSPLGKIPRGWEVDQVKNRASQIQYGFTQSASENPVGPKFLRITDIANKRLDWASVPFCHITEKNHEKYRLQEGDILVARTGATTGANIYIVDPPDAVFASYLVRIQFHDLSMARLVGEFMASPAYDNYVVGCIGGSAQPNASAQLLSTVEFVFPPLEIAKRFYEKVSVLDKKRAANDQQSHTLSQIREMLLPKLLSGEIRVADVDKRLEVKDDGTS